SRTYACVFAMGRPIGTEATSLSGPSSAHVASAATSDEPYKFSSNPLGTLAKNRSHTARDSGSPLLVQYRRRGRRAPRPGQTSIIAFSNDGTTTTRVTP